MGEITNGNPVCIFQRLFVENDDTPACLLIAVAFHSKFVMIREP